MPEGKRRGCGGVRTSPVVSKIKYFSFLFQNNVSLRNSSFNPFFYLKKATHKTKT